jgi:hypothetical protein
MGEIAVSPFSCYSYICTVKDGARDGFLIMAQASGAWWVVFLGQTVAATPCSAVAIILHHTTQYQLFKMSDFPRDRRGPFFRLAVLLLAASAAAQDNRSTQDISNVSAYTLQKPCARGCFQRYGICPSDVLGGEIGCVVATKCNEYGWQAPNDCYCRADFQNIALDYLSSCVSNSCSLGDVGIDASSAGSIYSQYCSQKGYPAALPASVPATTTTGTGGPAKTSAGGGVAGPTSAANPGQNTSSSESRSLSLTTIIGIAVGSLAGLLILAYLLRMMRQRFSKKSNYPQNAPAPAQQQPVYPMNPYYSPRYPSPKFEAELGPDDSASMLSGPVRPAPTLVSGVGNPHGRW